MPEDLASAALGRAIATRKLRAAILAANDGWQALYDQLRDAYTRAWTAEAKAAIADSLDVLRDLGPGRFEAADKALILDTLQARIGAEAMRAALRGPVINFSDLIFRSGFGDVGKATGVDISLRRPDLDALKVLTEGNLYWIEGSWNLHTKAKFDAILTDYFEHGMNRDQLVERMATDFGEVASKGSRYWEVLADHTATKTRELGRTTGYERAGVEYVQIRAHLDERTSQICRDLHGRVIEVGRLSAQKTTYLDAVRRADVAVAKRAWTMHGAQSDLGARPTRDLPAGTATPPYHFRCRTITVVWFPPTDAAGQWRQKTLDREPLNRAETKALIERLKTASWRSPESMKRHADLHGPAFGGSLEAYSAAAVDLIRSADRDAYLSVRGGRLKALFARPRKSSRKGPTSHDLCVVDVEGREIETLHRRRGPLSATYDDVQAIKLPARGIKKWLSI